MCHLTGLQTIGVGDKATMKKKTAERQAPPPSGHIRQKIPRIADSLDVFDQSCPRAGGTAFGPGTSASTGRHRSWYHRACRTANSPAFGRRWFHPSRENWTPKPIPRAEEPIPMASHRGSPKNWRSAQTDQQVDAESCLEKEEEEVESFVRCTPLSVMAAASGPPRVMESSSCSITPTFRTRPDSP